MPTSRVQLALNVSDLEAATRFYTDLFGVAPAKQRTGYANFEIADPPLKLVLFENQGAASPLNHLGVEVGSTAEVKAAARRFEAAGMAHSFAESDRCCHAVQDKVWVDAPDVPLGGWEFYTVLADDPTQDTGASGPCCGEEDDEGEGGDGEADAEAQQDVARGDPLLPVTNLVGRKIRHPDGRSRCFTRPIPGASGGCRATAPPRPPHAPPSPRRPRCGSGRATSAAARAPRGRGPRWRRRGPRGRAPRPRGAGGRPPR